MSDKGLQLKKHLRIEGGLTLRANFEQTSELKT